MPTFVHGFGAEDEGGVERELEEYGLGGIWNAEPPDVHLDSGNDDLGQSMDCFPVESLLAVDSPSASAAQVVL